MKEKSACTICNGIKKETNWLCHYKADKLPVGRPKKPKTVTPGLRVDADKWQQFTAKYPKQANKMFNEWVNSLL